MMHEIPTNANNIVRAEEFLKDMLEDDDEEKRVALPLPKRQSQSRTSASTLHDSFSNWNRSFHQRSDTSAGKLHHSFTGTGRTWKQPQSGVDVRQVVAGRSHETTPVGEGTWTKTKAKNFMDDVYLDGPSQRGSILRKHRGGVTGPFVDRTRTLQGQRRRASLLLLCSGLLFIGVGIFATTSFFHQKRSRNKQTLAVPVGGANSTTNTTDDNPGVGGGGEEEEPPQPANGTIVEEETPATDQDADDQVVDADQTLETIMGEEINVLEEEVDAVKDEETLADTEEKRQEFALEETVLEDLESTVSEELEVVQEEKKAIDQEDEDLLDQEESNLAQQVDELNQEANLIELESTAETPEDFQELKDEENSLEVAKTALKSEQQEILKHEAALEGWDYDKALEESHSGQTEVIAEQEVTVEERQADNSGEDAKTNNDEDGQ